MNELQRVEFEMLKELVHICDELGLTYYLVCGSALGAVKYKGFIPWDDDLDVALPRKDYEVFIKKAQAMLPDHIFLQNYETDPYFPYIFSKLRNCNTTFIEKSCQNILMNHGVYIDVFPLDGYPSDKFESQIFERKKRKLTLKINSAFCLQGISLKAKLFYAFERILGMHKKTGKYISLLSKMYSEYPTVGSKLICNHGNWQGSLEYAATDQYGKGVIAEFEGLNVRIPEKFDEYLTQKYGDWRVDPPESEQTGHHYCLVCDLNQPYTEYVTIKNY